MSCFGCINNGSQGSDYSDCWKCNLENHSFYEEDEEFTEIKKQIRADAIDEYKNALHKEFEKADKKLLHWIDFVEMYNKVAEQLKENSNG